ncbi:MAG: hypothetical protein O3C10_09370 [Chloroflexi bacterium]|nr:hypothetical protein [Chloroflexota bacterium]
MPTQVCEVSGCYETVESTDFACSEHMMEFEDGDLDECDECDGLKYVDEPVCLECSPGIMDDSESEDSQSKTIGPKTSGAILAWEPEPDNDGLIEFDDTGS